jgi:hypothetical protein
LQKSDLFEAQQTKNYVNENQEKNKVKQKKIVDITAINPLTAGHENIRAAFKCPQCYARVKYELV